MPKIHWLDKPETHDYPAAADYLELIADGETVSGIVDALRGGTVALKKAKDILRAARLPLLPADNAHVKSDLQKVGQGKPLSPILLVRGQISPAIPLQIADGYHRVCASYYLDENTDIPVILATLPGSA
ncbi:MULTISPECIES: hypothetical protein [unclassified Mycolicibacterium]|uniref:hypothetical protein n=1 Tax=unclassified Mycolicibacterium TaxID=2636767 RepID=UPI0012DC18BF|nr:MULTISPECIES: hypothetical protein [unclassified Mycolicibacterium]MUL80908.1 hypothetical protein [Mycolicibacterium sp. CBMA 329]MUL86674.1 hypothetical protein [Mycolicibacterium sp. CBMA 331]MUM02877.1 hypothetical protein [Mycolicibacterium sp. CBMA 334]MUM29452.1 hypothetical protein [Mycolicibacterium sp. CBMA 295]MUM36971.1 hypothetical protein [Mycolicibacterium sp. CBMA 247]